MSWYCFWKWTISSLNLNSVLPQTLNSCLNSHKLYVYIDLQKHNPSIVEGSLFESMRNLTWSLEKSSVCICKCMWVKRERERVCAFQYLNMWSSYVHNCVLWWVCRININVYICLFKSPSVKVKGYKARAWTAPFFIIYNCGQTAEVN